MDCAICIEQMQTMTFDVEKSKGEDDVVDSVDTQCLRLKCGHAYHASCIMESFRNGGCCPICRDTRQPLQEFSESPSDQRALEYESQRLIVRSTNRSVKSTREKLNKEVKAYNILCENLKFYIVQKFEERYFINLY